MAKIARDGRGSPDLLARILQTPQLERVIPRLPAPILHRVIETCGLEDCGELVALATPQQLSAVFDLDLWRSREAGQDEAFDAGRFGVWLEVLVECGASFAAQRLSEVDRALITSALAEHIAVFDPAAFSSSSDVDGREVPERARRQVSRCEVGGYIVEAKRTEYWDAIVDVLIALDQEHRDCFHAVMRACRRLSNSTPEADGFHDLLDDSDQFRFDLALDRERRRETHGYVAPPQARAFLQSSRELRLDAKEPPPANPIVLASLRGSRQVIDAHDEPTREPVAERDDARASAEVASGIAAVFDVLLDAGVVPDVPRALLPEPDEEGTDLGRFKRHMLGARELDPAAYSLRTEELAFLANVLVAGCPLQGRTFTTREAFDGAVAICNLGLENWPRHWLPPDSHRSAVDSMLPSDFLVGHDLTMVFQVGWSILHEDVCRFVTRALIDVLGAARRGDRDVQIGLLRLRASLIRHLRTGAPWRARDAFDVLMLLDMPAWAALLGLIAECPVMLANVSASGVSRPRVIDASEYAFISESTHIARVREFVRTLPDAFNS